MKITTISEFNYAEVAKIYKDGINTGLATFETKVPNWKDWNATHLPFGRISIIDKEQMLGWAALAPVSKRNVYKGVTEVSIYIAKNKRGNGIGTLLLKSLIKISEEHKMWTLQAGIMEANKASIQMHLNCGFRKIGYREKIGNLNGVWLNNIILERRSKTIGI